MITCIIVVITALFGIFYASNLEWGLHMRIMHRPFFGFTYPYKAHALTHHVIFGWGKTYTIGNHPKELQEEHIKTIPMAWWNGPVLTIIAAAPWVVTVLFGLWYIPVVIAGAVFGYYLVYEWIHWCMHDPKFRWVEQPRIFRRLNMHHRIHHKFMGKKNFNVVLPVADWMYGTLQTSLRPARSVSNRPQK